MTHRTPFSVMDNLHIPNFDLTETLGQLSFVSYAHTTIDQTSNLWEECRKRKLFLTHEHAIVLNNQLLLRNPDVHA